MTQLLVFRERMIQFYQRHARLLKLVFRFLISLLLFFAINREVGYDPALRSWYIVVGISIVGLVLPQQVLLFLAALYTTAHIYYVSGMLALTAGLIFALLYFVYIRFVPEHGYVILAVPLLFAIRIPYALPLLLGMVSAPVSLIPMSCGLAVYKLIQAMTVAIGTATDDTVLMYNQVIQQTFSDRELYFMIGIFGIVMVLVYCIRNSSVAYAFHMAVPIGAIANIVLFLITNFISDSRINVWQLLVQTILSAGAAYCIQFFLVVLNYSGTEYLQFEDEEYYYYVKAVPKMSITTPNKHVKRFTTRLTEEEVMEEGLPIEEEDFPQSEEDI